MTCSICKRACPLCDTCGCPKDAANFIRIPRSVVLTKTIEIAALQNNIAVLRDQMLRLWRSPEVQERCNLVYDSLTPEQRVIFLCGKIEALEELAK
jgi:hypothetical protein